MSKGKIHLPKKMIFVGNFALSAILAINLSGCVDVEALKIPSSSYVESTIPEELETLIKDCAELERMNQNTINVEKQISARIILLKEELRAFVEQALDVDVTLDGELLTYEKVTREKKYIDEEISITDPNWSKKIGVQTENGYSFYYYTKKDLYQLDVDEECMMALIRFINSKKTPTVDEILSVLESYEQAKEISYGYRTAYLTCIDEKAEVGKNRETTVYTGTVFNNTQYSFRTVELIDKILLKAKTDYISRTGSTYPATEYITDCVEGRWLIIHEKTGATDLLSAEESQLCQAVADVEACLDENGLLANDKKSDFQIETLQYVLEEYLKGNEEKQK